jgi:ABC-2 type transport system permease protein
VGNIMMPLNFVRIPLLFISGVFIPIEGLPLIGQAVACLSPLTHTLVLIRRGLGVESFNIPLEMNVIALVATSLLFLYLSFKFHESIKKRE